MTFYGARVITGVGACDRTSDEVFPLTEAEKPPLDEHDAPSDPRP